MSFFEFNDLVAIAKIAIVLFSSGFALYLPLLGLLKERRAALALSIPISLSTEIIVGYFFYTFGGIFHFHIIYLIIIFLLNIVSFLLLIKKTAKNEKSHSKNKLLLISAVLIIPILFTRFYDSVTNTAPGGIDTATHVLFFIDQMVKTGWLGEAFYAPGFHILVFGLTKIISYSELYRFTGPVFGLLIVTSFWLILRNFFQNKTTIIFLMLLLCFPVFNQFSLQSIYFFPSSLTFIFFLGFLYLFSPKIVISNFFRLFFYAIILLGLAFSVPYFYITFLPAQIIFSLIILLDRRYERNYKKNIKVFMIMTFLGLIVSFGHVYLQTSLRPGGFPTIPIASNAPAGESVNFNTDVVRSEQNPISRSIVHLSDRYSFVNSFILPTYGSAVDSFRFKNLRVPTDVLSFGAYFWIFISFFFLIYSIKKKDPLWTAVFSFSLFYGLSIQTGMFEMSYYRGRSGWYLLMLSIIGLALIFDGIKWRSKSKIILYLLLAGLFVSSFIRPPVFYRAYIKDPFAAAYEIKEKFPGKNVTIISNQRDLALLSNEFNILKLVPESFDGLSAHSFTFLILEKKYFKKDPVLSQQALATDKGYKEFDQREEKKKEKFDETNLEIKSLRAFKLFDKYWENDNIEVYKVRGN